MSGFDRRSYMAEHELLYTLTPTSQTGVFRVTWNADYLANREGEVDLPERVRCEMGVCGTCSGHGKVVDPSIDSDGLTPEDFAEDADFADSYHNGFYDIPCPECEGLRVVPVPAFSEELKAILEGHEDALRADYMERLNESRRGY